jgi:hypothetical protein
VSLLREACHAELRAGKHAVLSRKSPRVSLLREAFHAKFRAGKHAARRAVLHRPYQVTAAVAAVAVVGGVAAVGGPTWASAAGSTSACSHSVSIADSVTGKSDAASKAFSAPVSGHAASVRAHTVNDASHAKPKPQHKAGPTKPYRIYDSVTPTAIPGGKPVATYSNGTYQASRASVAGRGDVLWIDVNGSNPGAHALDVEPGDATPATAAAWASVKLTKDHNSKPIVYTMRSWWSAVQASMNGLPGWMHSHIRYWIADPTGSEHILPGADATQWYWGKSFDITTAKPGFWK